MTRLRLTYAFKALFAGVTVYGTGAAWFKILPVVAAALPGVYALLVGASLGLVFFSALGHTIHFTKKTLMVSQIGRTGIFRRTRLRTPALKRSDILDVLSKDTIIGSDAATGGQFTFNPMLNEYRFLIDGSRYASCSGQDQAGIEDLLSKYNVFIGAAS